MKQNQYITKYLKGFTLLEMMVALVLSGILITLGASVWLSFQRMEREKFKTMESLKEAELLSYRLILDTDRAYQFREQAHSFRLFNVLGEVFVEYHFEADKIVRFETELDTFWVEAHFNTDKHKNEIQLEFPLSGGSSTFPLQTKATAKPTLMTDHEQD